MAGQIDAKTALREQLLRTRSAHGALTDASAAVCRRLSEVLTVSPGMHLLGYAATPREVNIDAALRGWLHAGVVVCLPWVDGPRLGLGTVSDLDAVDAGWRGVREPRQPRTPVSPLVLDALVVPGVGFDADGNRLGYGGGHFDRLLAAVRPDVVVVGAALDEQIVERVPTEPHDRRVDLVVTPTRVLGHARL